MANGESAQEEYDSMFSSAKTRNMTFLPSCIY